MVTKSQFIQLPTTARPLGWTDRIGQLQEEAITLSTGRQRIQRPVTADLAWNPGCALPPRDTAVGLLRNRIAKSDVCDNGSSLLCFFDRDRRF